MEISFACKRIQINQILRCSFGLSAAEFETLRALLKRGESTVEELASALNKDRTTVQRATKPLLAKGLVKRRQYNLESGGYQYSYSPADKDMIKREISKQFSSFSELVQKEIEKW